MSYFCKNHTAYSKVKILQQSGKTNGGGKALISHRTNHSKGVITLINPSLNFKVEKLIPDKQGRFIISKLSLYYQFKPKI